ncbi:MAG: sodium-independent anion transporter, partial [Acidimicrobiales bacterium]|nr:sodium-independent anion transporter [Acidimicrobiales bacterium]
DVDAHEGYREIPGLLIYRFDAPLIFTNCDFLVDDLTARIQAADPAIQRVILDFETIEEVDTTGLDVLLRLTEDLGGEGIVLDVAHLRSGVLSFIERMGAVERIGRDHVFTTVREAVAASASSSEGDPA